MKGWTLSVYDRHIGIVDEQGCTVASISGERGDKRVWKNANMIIEAVNQVWFNAKKD